MQLHGRKIRSNIAQHKRYRGIMICTRSKALQLFHEFASVKARHQVIPTLLVRACSGGTYIAVDTDCRISNAFNTALRLSYSSRILSLSVRDGSEIGAGRCFFLLAVLGCLTSGTASFGTAAGRLSIFSSCVAVSISGSIDALISLGASEASASLFGNVVDETIGASFTMGG